MTATTVGEGFLDPYTIVREGPGSTLPVASPEEMAREIKHAAKTLGADLVGITGNDERWLYTHAYSRENEHEKPQEISTDLGNVIVIAQAMDRELLRTAPSALSGTATGATYSRDTIVLLAIAQYITNLGYRAVASMNDSAVAIPLAIKAGLGEYGRHGLLITREYGPPGPARQGLHRHAACPRPAGSLRRQGDVRHLPRVHERLPRKGHRRRRTFHSWFTIDRTFKASENGPLMPRNASASGPTRTPTARSACASAHTTATIATGGVECGDGWRARGSGDSRFGWTASVDAVSA